MKKKTKASNTGDVTKQGLSSKEKAQVKNMYPPHEETQRMKKGTDRA